MEVNSNKVTKEEKKRTTQTLWRTRNSVKADMQRQLRRKQEGNNDGKILYQHGEVMQLQALATFPSFSAARSTAVKQLMHRAETAT